jgi:DNA-binding beta-propeller fold protein YncE
MGYIIGGIVVVVIYVLCCSGGTITKKVCESDGFYHNVTYEKAFTGSAGKQLDDKPTSEMCECFVTGVGQISSGPTTRSLLHPHQEDNCHSGNPQGDPEPLPSEDAAGSTSGFGGQGNSSPTSGGEDAGPPPDPQPSGEMLPLARRLAARAVTPGSAFTYTLPFRNLPAGPQITGTSVAVSPTCNTNLNPTDFRVYHVDNVVKRTNMCTGQTVATINVPALPLQLKVTPDGSTAVVTSYSGAVTFIDTGTNQVSGSVTVPTDPNFTPSGLAISPDGAYALVTNYETPPDSYLLVIDLAAQKVTQQITLDNDYPQSVFINPDGTLAWIFYPWVNSVEVMDILTGTIVESFIVTEPFSMAFNATGTQAFLSSAIGSVEVFDTKTYALIKTIPADFGATDLQLSPDGQFILVNNSSAQSVTVIETASLTGTTYSISGTPLGSVLVPTQ